MTKVKRSEAAQRSRWLWLAAACAVFVAALAGLALRWQAAQRVPAPPQVRTLMGHGGSVLEVAYSPNGAMLASVSGDTSARLWDAALGRPIAVMAEHLGQVTSASFSWDSAILATGGLDQWVILWDTKTHERMGALPLDKAVHQVVFHPTRDLLAISLRGGEILLWDIAQHEMHPLLGHTQTALTLAYSPDGTRLVSGGLDHTVRVWDVAQRTEIMRLEVGEPHRINMPYVAYSPDGSAILTGDGLFEGSLVRQWSATTGQQTAAYETAGQIHALAYSPDGRYIIASTEKQLWFWRAQDGTRAATMDVPGGGQAHSIAMHPSGGWLAAGGTSPNVMMLEIGHLLP